MRKFKSIFYPIYVVVIILVLLMAFNIYEALELFKRWGWYKYFSDLPFMGRNLLVFLCALMITEFIIENMTVFSRRARLKKLENEIIGLKAKLFDQDHEADSEEEDAEDESNED